MGIGPQRRQLRNGSTWAFIIGLCLFMGIRDAKADPERVWLDVDCSAGIFTKDVDDALALVQAFRSPELEIRGISVVYGNASLEACLPITRELAQAYGPKEISVVAGASSPEELGKDTPAHESLVTALEEGPMTIFALGPATTIASLLKLRPDLVPRIRCIVLVAGRRPGQHFHTGSRPRAPLSDFNFERDPEAMQVLLDAPVDLVFAPWEVSSQLWILEADLDALETSGGSGAWIAEKSRPWLLLWQRVFHAEGFNPFDTLALGYVTHPALFEGFEGAAEIETAPDDVAQYRNPEGSPLMKPYLHVRRWDGTGRRVTYVHTVDADRFKDVLIERLSGLPNAESNPQELTPESSE